jgi:hypothetical protein
LNARAVTALLAFLLPMSVRATQKEVETPQGSFRWKELPDTKLATFVRELTTQEVAALDYDADHAARFIEKYVPLAKRSSDLLENLDAAFEAWHSSRAADREPHRRLSALLALHTAAIASSGWGSAGRLFVTTTGRTQHWFEISRRPVHFRFLRFSIASRIIRQIFS